MRLPGSAKVLETRRRRALALVEEGLSLNAVTRRLGCAASSVLRWQQTFRCGGAAGLRVRRAPGRPPRLSPRHRERLLTLLLRGAMARGYRTDVWTTQRIAEVIAQHFGVGYHRDHVGRLMASLGWSYQEPERRARERDEAAIARWKRTQWPRIKKRHAAGGRPRLLRRIGVPAGPPRAQDLGPPGADPGAAALVPSRQGLGHLRSLGEPAPAALGVVLPLACEEPPTGGSLCVPPPSPARPTGPHHCPLGQRAPPCGGATPRPVPPVRPPPPGTVPRLRAGAERG